MSNCLQLAVAALSVEGVLLLVLELCARILAIATKLHISANFWSTLAMVGRHVAAK